jgi:hypothetical protein
MISHTFDLDQEPVQALRVLFTEWTNNPVSVREQQDAKECLVMLSDRLCGPPELFTLVIGMALSSG